MCLGCRNNGKNVYFDTEDGIDAHVAQHLAEGTDSSYAVERYIKGEKLVHAAYDEQVADHWVCTGCGLSIDLDPSTFE